MPTLAQIWAARDDITHVAQRASNGVYVSLGHDTPEEAVEAARKQQGITCDDITANNWIDRAEPH